MPDPTMRNMSDGVTISQGLAFPRILSAVSAALQPARLVLGLLMVAALITFGRAWDWGYRQMSEHSIVVAPDGRWTTIDVPAHAAGEPTVQTGPFAAAAAHVSENLKLLVEGVFELRLDAVRQRLGSLFVATPVGMWTSAPWFTVVYGLFMIVVFALGGGAISRMSAVQTATQERLRIREALDFSLGSWGRLMWALVLPLLIAGIVSLVVLLMGVLMVAPVLDIIGSVLYGLALALGFVIAFLLLGYLLGADLLVPAVACENCDGADAMQRAYAYVASRPLHLLWYWLVTLVGLALGLLLVSLVAALMIDLTAVLFGALTNNPAMEVAGGYRMFQLAHPQVASVDGAWHHQAAAWFIVFWQTVVVSLVGGYVLSYVFSASTIVYLLMRRVCDGQEMEEIWRPGLIPGTMAPASPSTAGAAEPSTSGAV